MHVACNFIFRRGKQKYLLAGCRKIVVTMSYGNCSCASVRWPNATWWIDMASSTWHERRMQLRRSRHFTIPTSRGQQSTWNSQLESHAEAEEDAEMTEEVDQWEVVGGDETVVETLVLDHTMIEEVGIVCTSVCIINSDKTIFSFNFLLVFISSLYMHLRHTLNVVVILNIIVVILSLMFCFFSLSRTNECKTGATSRLSLWS